MDNELHCNSNQFPNLLFLTIYGSVKFTSSLSFISQGKDNRPFTIYGQMPFENGSVAYDIAFGANEERAKRKLEALKTRGGTRTLAYLTTYPGNRANLGIKRNVGDQGGVRRIHESSRSLWQGNLHGLARTPLISQIWKLTGRSLTKIVIILFDIYFLKGF